MTTLNQLKTQVEHLIDQHGGDHHVACFIIGANELQNLHLELEQSAIDESRSDDQVQPLSEEQLAAAVHHLENDGTALAKLFGAPVHEAIDAALGS